MQRPSLIPWFAGSAVVLRAIGALYLNLVGRDSFTTFLSFAVIGCIVAALVLFGIACGRGEAALLSRSAAYRARDRRAGWFAWPGVLLVVAAIWLMGHASFIHDDRLFDISVYGLIIGAAMIAIGGIISPPLPWNFWRDSDEG